MKLTKLKAIIITISTIIVFMLFVVLATYSHRLITGIFDTLLISGGILNPILQALIIIPIVILILVVVFHKNIGSFFKK